MHNTNHYTFNPHGVCTNPDTVHHQTNKQYTATARVAQAPDGHWYYAISVNLNQMPYTGYSGPCTMSGTPHPTKDAATAAARRQINDTLARFLQIEHPPATNQLQLF